MREKASEMLPLYSLDFLLHPASSSRTARETVGPPETEGRRSAGT
jgi:hypothetical protein